jgi:hypothetical protein
MTGVTGCKLFACLAGAATGGAGWHWRGGTHELAGARRGQSLRGVKGNDGGRATHSEETEYKRANNQFHGD